MQVPAPVDEKPRLLSWPLFLKIVFRTFFIQAAWNYQNFQGVGFAYCLPPFLRFKNVQGAALRDMVQRHLGCFNTNPYFSGMIVGGVLRMEEARLEGTTGEQEIEGFKKDLTGALGALGDSFVWGALRPMAGLAAVLTALISESLAPVVFLLMYNAVTLWLRTAGVRNGYRYGARVLDYLKKINLQRRIHAMNEFILFLMGALFPLWAWQPVRELSFSFLGILALIGALVWGYYYAERKGVPVTLQVAGLLLFSVLVGHLGWMRG